uniref:Uncharacterized protein n=1 Tax=Prymnesium polylepis TaxID=72548 RepID=A0A7S4I0N3_9EUKA|mmetsp:Transcript_24772/g.61529  ORF Transcript_24772/g.61529 Transcript_24772/m.61529 type:complete len:113 (+) Transcript_24772:2-340(+)
MGPELLAVPGSMPPPPQVLPLTYETTASKIGGFYNTKRVTPIAPPGTKWTTSKASTGVHFSAAKFLEPSHADPVVRWGQTMVPGPETTAWQTQSMATFPGSLGSTGGGINTL